MNDAGEQRIFNVGSGQGTTLTGVIRSVESVLNLRVKIDWKPSRPGDVPRSTLAVDRAKAVLGWSPSTSFEVGLRRTVDWWKSRQLHQ
jgi:UDP-glucose 4-epimerase